LIKIAHRGNVTGPSYKENQPSYITDAISLGYDVEIDIWKIKDNLWLGHDGPQYLVREPFLSEVAANAWFHCKNLEALYFFNTVCPHLNYFWHQEDDFTLTSQGYIWTYPDKDVTNKSIAVLVDKELAPDGVAGVCSDYIGLI
jgi:hypothetical protein